MAIDKLRSPDEAALRWLAHLDSPELTDDEKKAFFTWLESSTENQIAFIKMERLSQAGAKVARMPTEQNVAARPFILQPTWAVACVLLLAFVFVYTIPFGTHPLEDSYNLQTRIGEQLERELPDGSTLWLNTDSSVRVEFTSDQRRVFLNHGEAVFKVKKDDGKPFDVVTSSGLVRVLGTEFAVCNLDHDVTVTVVEGKVALGTLSEDSSTFKEQALLTNNQRLTIEDALQGEQARTFDAENSLGWRERRLVYRNMPLADVIKDINRYYPQKILLGDQSLKTMNVIAVLNIEGFQATVDKLATSMDLKVEYDGDNNNSRSVTLLPRT